jgi:hypothetical protein
MIKKKLRVANSCADNTIYFFTGKNTLAIWKQIRDEYISTLSKPQEKSGEMVRNFLFYGAEKQIK